MSANPIEKVISAANARPRFCPGSAPQLAGSPSWLRVPGHLLQCVEHDADQGAGAVFVAFHRVLRQPDLPAVQRGGGRADDLLQPGAVDHEFRGGNPGQPGRLRRGRITVRSPGGPVGRCLDLAQQ